jgi:hypothetical protein
MINLQEFGETIRAHSLRKDARQQACSVYLKSVGKPQT